MMSSNTRDLNQELFCRVFSNGNWGEYQNWDLSNFVSTKIANKIDFSHSTQFGLRDENGDLYETPWIILADYIIIAR